MRVGRAIVDGREAFVAASNGGSWRSLRSVVDDDSTTGEVLQQLEEVRRRLPDQPAVEVADEHLLNPVVRPGKIMCIGMNYLDHITETGLPMPTTPVVFAKFSTCLNRPYGDVYLHPSLTEKVDHEVELAVLIGRRAIDVDEEDALGVVAGYAVANDVSARDAQFSDGQFDRSKSFDGFAPIGPWVTTSDEVSDPQALRLRCRLGDEVRQDGTTADMIFGVAHLISYISRGMVLEPGDVLLTGTPAGVGLGMDPPSFLSDGDVVTCEIDGLGSIRNTMTSKPGVR